MSTGEFLDHDREHYLTWGLDFDYDPQAESGPIIDWSRKHNMEILKESKY